MSERVYTELSTRTNLGPTFSNKADNHQSIFLHLRYARVMDNGVYTCVTQEGTQTVTQKVTVDVQPPGGTLNCVTTMYWDIMPYKAS